VRTPLRTAGCARPGADQADNVLVAVRLLEEAAAAGLPFAPQKAARAIGGVRWPGRLERLDGAPPVLLDGAHNPAAARALAAHLRGIGPFVLVFGAMRDKDIAGMARALFPLAREVVLTRPRVERAARPDEIAERAGNLAAGARREDAPRRALAWARRRARGGATVVVAGSLFLVGELRPAAAAGSARGAEEAAEVIDGRRGVPLHRTQEDLADDAGPVDDERRG
jgi:dihydrofolate synthase/folylpolyglutamate synthase